MEAIHYKGDGPAITDLLGGHIDFYSAGAVREQVQSGRLRVLAVTGSERWFVFPDAPTFKELGIQNMEIYGFSGFLAPKGTPGAIVAKLNRAANEALQDPKVRERLQGLGFQVIGGSPAEFAKFIEVDTERIRKVGKENNLVIE
jgi:tripartite-type tricarboxylate transporter receptor subunit TctC